MNTVLIILIIYVLSVFLNRWINKIGYKQDKVDIFPLFWFIPIAPSLVIMSIIIEDSKALAWFTGKHWQ